MSLFVVFFYQEKCWKYVVGKKDLLCQLYLYIYVYFFNLQDFIANSVVL